MTQTIIPRTYETAITHTRTPCGVITHYEIFTRFHAYLVDLWRGTVARCTCGVKQCSHGQLALQLEDHWQAEHAPEAFASCMYCGHMAREVRGVAICGWCAS